ncbi:MAG: ABC transporter permease [Myxococcales bacterium]|nr:ABC transporter permease [Myxococcales bacterium]
MAYFVIKRFSQMVMVLFASSVLLFVVTALTPLEVEKNMLGPYATEQQYKVLHDKLRLDDPVFVRYVRWMGVLFGVMPDPLGHPSVLLGFEDKVRGDQYFGNFGYSRSWKKPVNDVIWHRFANSAKLAAIALAIIIPVSLTIGVLAGMREGSPIDRGLSLVSIVTTSTPGFVVGVLLLLVFVVQFPFWTGMTPFVGVSNLLPGTGPVWTHFVLPALTLAIHDFGYMARMVRGSMVEVMTQPYIRTAILKGLRRRDVIVGHALRNALIAPFTVMLLHINGLLGGVVIAETIFSYPGIGRVIVDAALFGDFPVIQATSLVTVVIVTTTQFIGDVGYMFLNPRIRFA